MKRSQTATAGLTILFVTFVFFAQGQSLVNVVKPSPTVQAMQKFGDIPVSAYTGVPEITVPIYTIEFRDLKVPVSLNYHASGIKVSEEAGNVGLGWSLNAGGAVSRNIIGGDDLDGTTYLSSALPDLDSGITYQNRIQGGCILALVNAGPRPLPTLFNYDLTNVLGNDFPADFQPDQYYYNILGRSGKFTIRHNGQVLLEKQEKLDISLTSGGAGWQIKDQEGFIYDFTVFETYQSSAGTPQQHKSAWFLTQITSPTGNKVTFNYTALPLNPITPMGSSYEIRDVFQAVVDFGGVTYQPPTLGYRTGTNPVSTYYSQQLSSIDFTNGLIRFSYSGDRTDLPGAFKLDSVSVFSKDAQGNVSATPVRTTSLTYDYFFGETYPLNGSLQVNTQKGPTTTRLKLMSVKNTGYLNGQRTVDSPYTFSYYEKDPSLQPTKNSIARDHWGYYNGKNSNSSLIPSYNSYTSDDQVQTLVGTPGPERDTDTLYSKLFSLTSITYPTGGSTEFQMEANDYDPALSSVNDHSNFAYLESIVPEVSSTGYDGYNHRPYSDSIMDLSSEYYNVTNGAGTPVSINVTVRCASDDINLQLNTTDLIYVTFIGQDGGVVLTKDLGNLSTCGPGQTLACLSKSGPAYTYTYTNIYLPPQKYTVRTYVDNSLRNTVMDFLVDVHWSARISGNLLAEPSLGIRNYGYAGGLRARRIIDHDGIDSANDHVKRYVYHYTADKGNGLQEFTYGRRMSRPQYFYFEWVQGVHSQPPANYYYTSEHLMRSSDSDIPLNGSAGGSPVGYDQVTVLDGENGENGKTVYTYYNQPDDIYDYNSVNGLPHRPPVTSSTAYSLNGSLLQQVDYANAGGSFYKRREIINDYTLFPARQNTLNGFEMRVPLSDGTNQPATSGCSHILMFYTALQSQWNYQLDHQEKMYNGGIDTFNYIDNHTYYSYENPAHFLPTRSMTFNSKGDTVTTITKYPLDYANGGSSDAFSMGINKLNTAHVVNAPVEVYKQINPLSGFS